MKKLWNDESTREVMIFIFTDVSMCNIFTLCAACSKHKDTTCIQIDINYHCLKLHFALAKKPHPAFHWDFTWCFPIIPGFSRTTWVQAVRFSRIQQAAWLSKRKMRLKLLAQTSGCGRVSWEKLYIPKDPFVCPKNPGLGPRSNPTTVWDGIFRPSILRIFGRGLDS